TRHRRGNLTHGHSRCHWKYIHLTRRCSGTSTGHRFSVGVPAVVGCDASNWWLRRTCVARLGSKTAELDLLHEKDEENVGRVIMFAVAHHLHMNVISSSI